MYPDHHPKAEKIKVVKSEIDTCYSVLKTYQQLSRDYYQNAMQSLKSMGDAHKSIHETLKEIADKLNTLKGLIDSPNI